MPLALRLSGDSQAKAQCPVTPGNRWKARDFTPEQDYITYLSGKSHGKGRKFIHLDESCSSVAIYPDQPTLIVLHDDDGRQ